MANRVTQIILMAAQSRNNSYKNFLVINCDKNNLGLEYIRIIL